MRLTNLLSFAIFLASVQQYQRQNVLLPRDTPSDVLMRMSYADQLQVSGDHHQCSIDTFGANRVLVFMYIPGGRVPATEHARTVF